MTHIDQEPDRIPTGVVRIGLIAIALSILVSVGATLLLEDGESADTRQVDRKPSPRVDMVPFALESEAEHGRRVATERLRAYGWVDRARGIVHVPLDVATELYLAERPR